MSETSARMRLPLIQPGQAQKELTHNEALAAIDTLLHPLIETMTVAEPPAGALAGACWIVSGEGAGDWAGQGGAIAALTDGGWRFLPGTEGMTVWLRDARTEARFHEGAWTVGIAELRAVRIGGQAVLGARQPAIAAPDGGGTIDQQSRETIQAILETLRNHGLVER